MTPPPLPLITRGALYSVVALFMLAVLMSAGNLLWTAREVNAASARAAALQRTSEHRWCTLLRTLTAQPVPAPQPGHKAQAEAYVLYRELTGLRQDLSCG